MDEKTVDHKLVREAAKDLSLKPGFHRLWTWIVIPLCILGVGLILLLLQKNGLLLPLYKGILQSFQNIGDISIKGFQNVLNFFK